MFFTFSLPTKAISPLNEKALVPSLCRKTGLLMTELLTEGMASAELVKFSSTTKRTSVHVNQPTSYLQTIIPDLNPDVSQYLWGPCSSLTMLQARRKQENNCPAKFP